MDDRQQTQPLDFLLALLGIDIEKAAPAILKMAAIGLILLEAFRFGQHIG
jgi:hypothetical protein